MRGLVGQGIGWEVMVIQTYILNLILGNDFAHVSFVILRAAGLVFYFILLKIESACDFVGAVNFFGKL